MKGSVCACVCVCCTLKRSVPLISVCAVWMPYGSAYLVLSRFGNPSRLKPGRKSIGVVESIREPPAGMLTTWTTSSHTHTHTDYSTAITENKFTEKTLCLLIVIVIWSSEASVPGCLGGRWRGWWCWGGRRTDSSWTCSGEDYLNTQEQEDLRRTSCTTPPERHRQVTFSMMNQQTVPGSLSSITAICEMFVSRDSQQFNINSQ